MARINIEEKLFADLRFKALIRKLKSEREAIGTVVEAYFLGLKYWSDNQQLIPENIWVLSDLECLIDVQLAERQEDGIYVKGSEEYFDWLYKKKASASTGGKKSASRPRDEKGRLLPSTIQAPDQAPSKQCLDKVQALSSPPTPTPTPTPTPAPAQKKKKNLILAEGASPPSATKGEKSPGSLVWEAYSDAYEKTYGVKPARNAREASLCSQLCQRVGNEDGAAIARFYVSHKDRWYVQKLHPLNLLLADAQKLRTEWLAGVQMTSGMARTIEVKKNNDEVIKKYLDKERGL